MKLWTHCTVLLGLLVKFPGTRDVFRLDQVQKRATRLVKRLKGLLKGSRGVGGSLGQWLEEPNADPQMLPTPPAPAHGVSRMAECLGAPGFRNMNSEVPSLNPPPY